MPVTGAKVILAVSVGNPAFEDGSLRAILLYARDAKSVKIVLGCTLQRHNLEIEGKEASVALRQSDEAGDAWLVRNDAVIKGILEKTYEGEACRWNEWLNTPQYQKAREEFDLLCNKPAVVTAVAAAYLSMSDTNPFRNDSWEYAMFASIISRLNSCAKKWKLDSSEDRLQTAINECYEYLAEETIIIYKLWPITFCGYAHILYPSLITPILEKGYNEFIVKQNQDPRILQWECVNIKIGKRVDRRNGFFLPPPFELSSKDREMVYSILAKYTEYLNSQPSGKQMQLQLYLLQILALSPRDALLKVTLDGKTMHEEDSSIADRSPHSSIPQGF